MGFDVAIVGTMVFGAGEMAAWKRVVVDSTRFRSIARVFPSAPNLDPVTVGALLKELPQAGWHDLFSVTKSGATYKVRARFAEAPFRARCRQLAALFMTAADVDGRGDIYMLGEGVPIGYAVQLPGGKPILSALDDEEMGRRTRDPELDYISAYFRVASESQPPPPPAPPPSSRPKTLLRLRGEDD